MPPAGKKSKYGIISKSQILTTLLPQGHVMSMKCEQPLDELTVQVWLLYDYLNFKYCTLNVSGTELRTDKWTDGQTDDPNTQCPCRTRQCLWKKVKKTTMTLKLGSLLPPLEAAFGSTLASELTCIMAKTLWRRRKLFASFVITTLVTNQESYQL